MSVEPITQEIKANVVSWGMNKDLNSSKLETNNLTNIGSNYSPFSIFNYSNIQENKTKNQDDRNKIKENSILNSFPKNRFDTNLVGTKKELINKQSTPELYHTKISPQVLTSNKDIPNNITYNKSKFFVIKDDILDSIEQTNTIPDRLVIKYVDDYNILWVNRMITTHFSSLHKKIPKLEEDLKFHNVLLSKVKTEVDRYDIDTKIKKIKDEILDIENKTSWRQYVDESKDLINRYIKIKPMHRMVRFGKKDSYEVEDIDIVNIRIIIISEYLNIASKYYPMDIYREAVYNPYCPVCNINLEESGIETEGILQCPCGYEEKIYTKESMYKDTTRVESNRADSNYQDRENFEKAIIKFQGKQDNNLPDSLFEDLDKYCVSYEFPVSSEIQKMPLNKDGTRGLWKNANGTIGRTSREFLFKALKETGNSDYYEDERLILYLYWNWPRPNISHLEDKLRDDYDLTQGAYVQIPKVRKSSLNTQYRLFRHLQANDCKYTIDDFRVVKTPDILQEHDELWTKMCRMTKYPLILSYH